MDIISLQALALSVRSLSIDAVQAANSGHPGLPLGCADFGAFLYGFILKHDPSFPNWPNRDRFILSAGHGSMLLYSLLHLTGYDMSLEEIRNFRQLGSQTAGHPEYGVSGIETTTGPLGAGFSNAVGIAIAEAHLASRWNVDQHQVIDHFTYALVSDGCLMEGVSSEAASLAGHLKLGKLIVFYDSNRITIEGSTDLTFTENVAKRFDAYGWQVLQGSAYDYHQMDQLTRAAQSETQKPSLIMLESVIGYGSPKAGSHEVHGAPLGVNDVKATKEILGLPPDQEFTILESAKEFLSKRRLEWKAEREAWQRLWENWSLIYPERKAEWVLGFGAVEQALDQALIPSFTVGESVATRVAGGKALAAFAQALPTLLGGSADLAPSNNTNLPYGDFQGNNRSGRTLHFGVREHAMGGIVNGMVLHGGVRAFGATFLTFSDYMRPSIRLAALMQIPSLFVFTHDSIYLGEDGPTHQPVEHVESLRLIPGLLVLRPGDAQETVEAWRLALRQKNRPTALLLTRQNLKVYAKPQGWQKDFYQGAYTVLETSSNPETVILSTGSEVSLALEAADLVTKAVRVVSVSSRELLTENPTHLKKLIPAGARVVAVEAGCSAVWKGLAHAVLGVDRFGESGPGGAVAKHLGLTSEKLAELL